MPDFIKYSVHFFTLKMVLKYSVEYTWKVAEKGFKMAFMMNKDATMNSCKIILEKKIPKIIVKFRCAL